MRSVRLQWEASMKKTWLCQLQVVNAGITPCEVTRSQWMDNGEQKPGVKERIMLFLQKLSWFILFLCLLCFLFFLKLYRLCLILNKSGFFGLAEVFPYSSQSLFPSKALQNAAARDFHRMAADASHAKEQRAEKSGGKLLDTILIHRISTWFDI